MTGTPCSAARRSTVAPEAPVGAAMISTLTCWVSMLSAIWANFWVSPCAFWMMGVRPCFSRAAFSMGSSTPAHRADVAVSGRITPTLAPPPPAGAGALDPPEPPEPLESPALLLAQPASASARLEPTATKAATLLRMGCPFLPGGLDAADEYVVCDNTLPGSLPGKRGLIDTESISRVAR